MKAELTAVFQKVPEGYIGFVEELPGANTQGAMLAEARANLVEAVRLVIEAYRALAADELQGAEVLHILGGTSPGSGSSWEAENAGRAV